MIKIILEERQAVARAAVKFNDPGANDVACRILASNVATYVTELMTTKKHPGFKNDKTTMARRNCAQPLIAQLLLDNYDKLAALYERCADDAIDASKRGARAAVLPPGRVVPSPFLSAS